MEGKGGLGPYRVVLVQIIGVLRHRLIIEFDESARRKGWLEGTRKCEFGDSAGASVMPGGRARNWGANSFCRNFPT